MANLKAAVAIQEAERTAADAARNRAEQGHRCLKAECQGLHSTCAGESSLSVSPLYLLVVPGCGLVAFSGLCAGALLDLEARMAVEQRAQEVAAELAALITSRWAMCDVMLSIDRADTQLVLRIDETRLWADLLLISKGIHSGVLAALTSICSHYGGIDYNALGQGYSSGMSDNEILAIGNSAARGVEVLVSKVLAAPVRL